MSDLDRVQFLRIDCPTCKGKGYTLKGLQETFCETCGGSGSLEKEVGYRHETRGEYSIDEKAEIFELPEEQIKDTGHDSPSLGAEVNQDD